MLPSAHVTREAPSVDLAAAVELDRLELAVYVTLRGAAATARRIGAAVGDAWPIAARARLLLSDVLSRGGELAEALALQREVSAEANARRTGAIEARANCLMASTYSRLGLLDDSVAAAELGVALLDDDGPAHWPAEHYMVLALFTSYDRPGTIDFGLFEEALRRARDHGDPTLVIAVLNNYAYTAVLRPQEIGRAVVLVDEMERLGGRHPSLSSVAVIDTIAWVRFTDGDAEGAQELLESALAHGARVEPDDEAAVLSQLATMHAARGDDTAAADLLERARAIALQAGTPEVAIDALRALSELDARSGDYRRAYERMAQHIDERDAAQRGEAERRATVLQAIHGTELERSRRRHYESLASRDQLTGLFNRRYLETAIPALLRAGGVAVVLVDIDHFKSVNDRFSHGGGDAVLATVGGVMERACAGPSGGFAARLGGEEFLLVLPGIDATTARATAEEVRATVAACTWPAVSGDLRCTISCGVAISGADGRDLAPLLTTADRRLYLAKRGGRDRTVTTG
jgi:two-component system cell cycle response regulator